MSNLLAPRQQPVDIELGDLSAASRRPRVAARSSRLENLPPELIRHIAAQLVSDDSQDREALAADLRSLRAASLHLDDVLGNDVLVADADRIGARMVHPRRIAEFAATLADRPPRVRETLVASAFRRGVAFSSPGLHELGDREDALRHTFRAQSDKVVHRYCGQIGLGVVGVLPWVAVPSAVQLLGHQAGAYAGAGVAVLDAVIAGIAIYRCVGLRSHRARFARARELANLHAGPASRQSLAEGGEARGQVDRLKFANSKALFATYADGTTPSADVLRAAMMVNLKHADRVAQFNEVVWPALGRLPEPRTREQVHDHLSLVADMLIDRAAPAAFAGFGRTTTPHPTALAELERHAARPGSQFALVRSLHAVAMHLHRADPADRMDGFRRLLAPPDASDMPAALQDPRRTRHGLLWDVQDRADVQSVIATLACVRRTAPASTSAHPGAIFLSADDATWIDLATQRLRSANRLQDGGGGPQSFEQLGALLRDARLVPPPRSLQAFHHRLDRIEALRLDSTDDEATVDRLLHLANLDLMPPADRLPAATRWFESMTRIRSDRHHGLLMRAAERIVPAVPANETAALLRLLAPALNFECFNAREVIARMEGAIDPSHLAPEDRREVAMLLQALIDRHPVMEDERSMSRSRLQSMPLAPRWQQWLPAPAQP